MSAAGLETGLREAIDAAVLIADENGYVFRHALLREVIHDDLLPGQHARLHARFAAHAGGAARAGHGPRTATASEIAHHWSAAHEVDKAFRWSITAADAGHRGVPRGAARCTSAPWSCGTRWTIPSRIAGDHASCAASGRAQPHGRRGERARAGAGRQRAGGDRPASPSRRP